MPIVLPSDYGYVLLVAASSFFVNTLHSSLTMRARKASGIKYPAAYAANDVAEKDPLAHKFNCAQRAHANFTDNLTPFLGELLITGLRYPIFAASAGGVWVFGRVIYAIGYTNGGPQGRTVGSIVSALTDFVLKLTAVYSAAKFVL
ncbi:hypothetical protein QBC37DRAFT_109844 [Rhypophila decipiens]|uniref:Microsomal glutathione S-transferase 3 n=1 Tax=Rhypophila decipiens TaxID=261697 RepID=A0AAN6YJE3_9PEZI|nr:hypothetical protein QBC37DRAFT_109844 [Rhypophila decipiens]